ncbi:hypothetical protein FRC00_007892, partial [Tulasnella sp. 408]
SKMGKKPLPSLPWEIFSYILTFIPPPQLLSVILACQAFRRLAEPLLYRHIDLSNCPTRSLYLLRTLLSRKELCKHVRTFQPADRHTKPDGYLGVFKKIVRGQTQEYMRRTAYIQHSERVAGRLTYVENISIHTSSEQVVRALGGLSKIKKFRTLHPWGLRQHEPLLDALPNVTHLELPFTSFFLPVSEIRPDHTQLVEELICPTNVAGPPDSFELMKEMARSTETIKVLAFHKLRVLDFNGSAGYGVDYFDHRRNAISAVYTRILQTWSERCPTLEKVVFPNGAIWVKEPIFRRRHALIHSIKTAPRSPRPLSKLTLSSFRRPSGTFSPTLSPADITSLEDKDVRHMDHAFTPAAADTHQSNFDVPNKDEFPNSDAEDLINTRREGPGSAPHNPYGTLPTAPTSTAATTTTGHRWRCLNAYLPRSNRTSHSFFSRIQGAENWSTPMFKRDLGRNWPEGLWNGCAQLCS